MLLLEQQLLQQQREQFEQHQQYQLSLLSESSRALGFAVSQPRPTAQTGNHSQQQRLSNSYLLTVSGRPRRPAAPSATSATEGAVTPTRTSGCCCRGRLSGRGSRRGRVCVWAACSAVTALALTATTVAVVWAETVSSPQSVSGSLTHGDRQSQSVPRSLTAATVRYVDHHNTSSFMDTLRIDTSRNMVTY